MDSIKKNSLKKNANLSTKIQSKIFSVNDSPSETGRWVHLTKLYK